jgi:hydroxymethylpyrimidine pyrophosphatase-like HAD family hydrolase
MCVEIEGSEKAEKLQAMVPQYDSVRFEGECWYKFTKSGITKENAVKTACRSLGIDSDEVTAFGDDIPDIGMFQTCGTGITMGNAMDEVKKMADRIIGTNDEDGIAEYIDSCVFE